MTEVRDVIIIGSGPAGYTAALYAARALRFARAEPVAIEGPTRGASTIWHQPGGTMQELTALAEPLRPDWVREHALPRLRGWVKPNMRV